MKILLLEDDIQLNFAISTYLKTKGYIVETFDEEYELFSALEYNSYDLFIFDINLSTMNGLDILFHIRKTNILTPIIIITASLEINNLTKAYNYGCNEYIKKPFHLKELDVRMHKLLKNDFESLIIKESLIYIKDSQEISFENQTIKLRKKELRFIELLCLKINKLVTYDEIIDYVWENEIKEDYPIRQLVNNIRRKIPLDFIITVFGLGYKIENKN